MRSSCILNRFAERFEVVGSVVALTVDEERWSSIHAAAHSSRKVGPYAGTINLLREGSLQIRWGEVKRLGQFQEEGIAQVLLIFKELIVHLPELTMQPRQIPRLQQPIPPTDASG